MSATGLLGLGSWLGVLPDSTPTRRSELKFLIQVCSIGRPAKIPPLAPQQFRDGEVTIKLKFRFCKGGVGAEGETVPKSCSIQGRKRNPNPNFLVRIFSSGVEVFHMKGRGPKSSVCPSKPGTSNFLGCPKSLRKKKFVFNFRSLFILGKRHGNRILKVQNLLSRNLVVIAQAPNNHRACPWHPRQEGSDSFGFGSV